MELLEAALEIAESYGKGAEDVDPMVEMRIYAVRRKTPG